MANSAIARRRLLQQFTTYLLAQLSFVLHIFLCTILQ
jgi:hypothetical protein